MRFIHLFRALPAIVLLLFCGDTLPADDHLPKDANWVLVGPNKGWWKEVQVPLGYRVWLGGLGGPGVWMTLSNDTNVAFTVRFDNQQPQNVLKKKGLASVDPREVLTPLYMYGDHPVYYVDDGKAANGYAKLRLEAP